ncbi:MAG: hypothetical protein M3068_11050 [Gemmatimonadota bacterium]|nr:hypothetical protein [Gemmatimonadota bacterium]
MTRRRALTACASAIAIAACSDNKESIGPVGRSDFATYVSIGTSISQGTMSDGVVYVGQQHSWTAQLARLANASYSIPLIQAPGCNPPLIAPLQLQIRLDGVAASQNDLTCAPNYTGIALPTNNVALDGATAQTALTVTPEIAVATRISRAAGQLYRRVLLPGQTQTSAMKAQQPTFVSVELGANELLGADAGLVVPNLTITPVDTFYKYYDAIIDSVKSTRAKGLLVGLVDDIASFPGTRRGSEIFADSLAFANGFYVNVSSDCAGASAQNLLFLPYKLPPVLGAAQIAAATGKPRPVLSCADSPGTVDFVLTPADAAAVNAQLAAMNAHIQSLATANGYAFFKLQVLYGLPKAPFSIATFLGSVLPFGPNITLDGVHPSAAGHTIIANAAAAAVDAQYRFTIPATATP